MMELVISTQISLAVTFLSSLVGVVALPLGPIVVTPCRYLFHVAYLIIYDNWLLACVFPKRFNHVFQAYWKYSIIFTKFRDEVPKATRIFSKDYV